MTTSKVNFKFNSFFKVFAFAITLLFFFGEANAQIRTFKGPKVAPLSKETLKNIGNNYIPCPDLKAEKIDFEIVGERSEHVLIVRVTGVVKNVGGQTYTSRANQQSVRLYIGRTYAAVGRSFTSLAPGESVSVSYTMDFYLGNEFPETAKVLVSFDPDIRNDGNSMNDDCRNANNSMSRSMAEVKDIPYLRTSTTVNAPVHAPIRKR